MADRQDILGFHAGEDVVIDITVKDRAGAALDEVGLDVIFVVGLKLDETATHTRKLSSGEITAIDTAMGSYQADIPAAIFADITPCSWRWYSIWTTWPDGAETNTILQSWGAFVLQSAVPAA